MSESSQQTIELSRRDLLKAALLGTSLLGISALALGGKADAYTNPSPPSRDNITYLANDSQSVINPSTEETLALVKSNLDSLLLKAGVLGSRNWSITETVPISHANLDAALSTLGSQATLALIKAKTDNLDAALSSLATQATLALIKAKTDNLDVLLSTIASQATLALIKSKTDNLDAALSTLATATGQSTTQPRNISQIAGTGLTGRD